MLNLHPATARLLAREQWKQQTPEWFAVRRTLLTASDAAAALDIKPFASYRGSPRADLLQRKLDDAPVSNVFTRHGQKYEDEARNWAAAALGETVMEVGLVVRPRQGDDATPWLAASPDGVTATGRLLEIKCPLKREIKPGHIPGHYFPQVQVQMEVCDIDSTLFVQYRPACPGDRDPARRRAVLDVVVIERDRAWFRENEPRLKAFWAELMTEKAKPRPPVEPAAKRACLVDFRLYDDV